MAYTKIEQFDAETTQKLAEHYYEILKLLGEDPQREGLLKTPERVAKALQFLTHGSQQDGAEILRSAMFKEEYQQMVLVKDIELYSTCEHHVMPFIGKAHVAYIPNGSITGLSKIARVVETFARLLQRCGHNIDFCSGFSLQKSESKSKSSHKESFAIFTRDKYKSLFEPPLSGPFFIRSHKIVNDKYLPVLEE